MPLCLQITCQQNHLAQTISNPLYPIDITVNIIGGFQVGVLKHIGFFVIVLKKPLPSCAKTTLADKSTEYSALQKSRLGVCSSQPTPLEKLQLIG